MITATMYPHGTRTPERPKNRSRWNAVIGAVLARRMCSPSGLTLAHRCEAFTPAWAWGKTVRMMPVDTAGPGDVGGDLHISVERLPAPAALFVLSGEADLHRAPELRNAMSAVIDDGITDLIVDLSEVTFIDSMTLGVLLGAMKRVKPGGGRLCVVVQDANIRRIFEITLLDRVFAVFDDREQALAALAPTAQSGDA
jgi:anti-sigma B factor antagonist